MFSDHLRKIDDAPAKTLLLIAAGLIIVCQLVAMVLVTGAQVEKAQLREASHASAMAVRAGCIESSRGAALRNCDTAFSSSAQVGTGQANAITQGMTLVTLSDR
jgi:hypothetical protein